MNNLSIVDFPENIQKSFVNVQSIDVDKIVDNFNKGFIGEDEFDVCMDIFQKGGMSTGTITTRKSGRFQKQSDGTWKLVKEDKKGVAADKDNINKMTKTGGDVIDTTTIKDNEIYKKIGLNIVDDVAKQLGIKTDGEPFLHRDSFGHTVAAQYINEDEYQNIYNIRDNLRDKAEIVREIINRNFAKYNNNQKQDTESYFINYLRVKPRDGANIFRIGDEDKWALILPPVENTVPRNPNRKHIVMPLLD